MTLSICIPAYNEEKNIERAVQKIDDAFKDSGAQLEFVFADDGSVDSTWDTITRLAESDERIRAVRFSRNFGKESAIFAALAESSGDAAIIMDADLQHPPETARKMYELWRLNDSLEIVEAVKRTRQKESAIKRFGARCFYGFFGKLSGLDLAGSTDFKLLSARVRDELLRLPERYTFFRALSDWIGFETEKVEFDVADRQEGDTKWSFSKLTKYAVRSISSFSSAPLQIVTVFGFIFLIFTVILGVQTLINFALGNSLEGFTTVILILLFMGTIIMLSLGVIGYYISRIYDELKQRPRYIIAQRISKENGVM